MSTGEQQDRPENHLSEDELLARVRQRDLERLRNHLSPAGDTGTRRDVHSSLHRQHRFDLELFERLQENPVMRRLTVEDLPSIGDVYRSNEVPEDTFEALYQRDYGEFKEQVRQGYFIDRWQTTNPDELQKLRQRNPSYVPSGEEFRSFLDGTHPRAADFCAWGHFDPASGEMVSLVSAFLPPKDPAKLEKHSSEVQAFFRANDENGRCFYPYESIDRDWTEQRGKTTAEFYLIGTKKKGLGATDFEWMLQQPEITERAITDWYLLRFGSMRMVEPFKDDRVSPDSPNHGSGELFQGKLGFSDLGRFVDHNQYAARKTRSQQVVVVRPGWIVMHGDNAYVRECSHNWNKHVQVQARSSRAKKAGS